MPMIELTLPYPISANRYWGTRVVKLKATGKWASMTYVTKEADAYKLDVEKLVLAAGIRKPLPGRVAIEVTLVPNRPLDWKKRVRLDPLNWDDTVQCIDLDNANKVLLDSLKGIAIEDDKWVRRITSERIEPDGGPARVVVRITPLAKVLHPQQDLLSEATS